MDIYFSPYDFVWTPAGFEFDLGGSRRSNSGSLRDQTLEEEKGGILSDLGGSRSPNSDLPFSSSRGWPRRLPEFARGGSRSLTWAGSGAACVTRAAARCAASMASCSGPGPWCRRTAREAAPCLATGPCLGSEWWKYDFLKIQFLGRKKQHFLGKFILNKNQLSLL